MTVETVKGISLIVKRGRNINYSAIIFTEVEVFNFVIKKTLFNTAYMLYPSNMLW